MKIKMMNPAQARDFSAFILPEVLEEREFDHYLFYVAIEDKTPCGMLVLDPRKVEPRIKSIATSPRYKKQGIATLLLKYAVADYMSMVEDPEAPNLFQAGFMIERKYEKAITRVFQKAGFSLDEQGEYYAAMLGKLKKSELLTSENVRKHLKERDIFSLNQTPYRMVRPFLRRLEEEGLLAQIDPDELEGDISFFGIKDEKIISCILFRKGEDDMLYNEYVYRDKEECPKGEIVYLFAACLKAALKKYDSTEVVTFLSTNPEVESMLTKLIPQYRKSSKYLVFRRDFSTVLFEAEQEDIAEDDSEYEPNPDKENDQPAFTMLDEKNMKCAGCKHCMGKILECQKYLQKPDPVLEGEECPMFEEKQEMI